MKRGIYLSSVRSKKRCNRCGSLETKDKLHHSLHNGEFILCFECYKLWGEECQLNGITGGKRNYKHFSYFTKDCHSNYWLYCFRKFIGEQPFVFR